MQAGMRTHQPKSSQTRRRFSLPFPLTVYLVAVLLRLIPVLLTRDLGIGLDDMFQYDMLGRSLAAGHGFRWYAPQDLQSLLSVLHEYSGLDTSQVAIPQDPRGMLTSFRAPVYPFFLALIYVLAGLSSRFFAARLAQALATATVAPLTYAIALRLGAQERHARLAAWVPTVWPMLVLFPLGLATENLFIPLLAAAVLFLLNAGTTGRSRDFVFAGLCLSLATLTRSVIVGFAGLAAAWLWQLKLKRGALLLLTMLAAFVIPWSVRNSLLHSRPTLVETSLGYNLYLGYHPQGDGSFFYGPSLDLITILDDAERDAEGRRRAWEFITQDPGRVPELMVRKLGHFWGLEDRAFVFFYSNGLLGQLPTWLVATIFLLLTTPLAVLLPFSILGWVAGPRDRAWWLITWLFAWYVGIHIVVMAEERFHLAILPMLAALSARGLSRWPDFRKALRARKTAARLQASAMATLVVLAFLNWGLELLANAGRLAVLFGPQGWKGGFPY